MSEPMPYGQVVQELTHLRAQYEQFIIDRERERTIRIIETRSGHQYEYSLCNCEWCDLIYLINDVNVL